jgi:hypothetical protein
MYVYTKIDLTCSCSEADTAWRRDFSLARSAGKTGCRCPGLSRQNGHKDVATYQINK